MALFIRMENNDELMSMGETHNKLINSNVNTEEDTFPTIQRKSDDIIIRIEDTAKIYSNQTGAFPSLSSGGYRDILIPHDVDSNVIMSRPLR